MRIRRSSFTGALAALTLFVAWAGVSLLGSLPVLDSGAGGFDAMDAHVGLDTPLLPLSLVKGSSIDGALAGEGAGGGGDGR